MSKKGVILLSLVTAAALFSQQAPLQPQAQPKQQPPSTAAPGPPNLFAPFFVDQTPAPKPPAAGPQVLVQPLTPGKLCSVPLLQMPTPVVQPTIRQMQPPTTVEPMPQAIVPAPPCPPQIQGPSVVHEPLIQELPVKPPAK